MVRLFSLSLLATFVGTALAGLGAEQEVLSDSSDNLLAKWSYYDCGGDAEPIHVDSIALSPDPPQPGKDLTVTVIGTAKTPIEEGTYADVVVKLGIIKLLSKQFDVCEEARAANISLQCPVEAGTHTITHTVALPREIPKAKFNVNVKGYDIDDDELFCLDLTIDFMQTPWLW